MHGGGSVVIIEEVTERKRAQDRIEHLARYDELTGLANRTQFVEQIERSWRLCARPTCGSPSDMIDLDRFKDDQRHARSSDRRQALERGREPPGQGDRAGRHDHALSAATNSSCCNRRKRNATPRRHSPSELVSALSEPFDIDRRIAWMPAPRSASRWLRRTVIEAASFEKGRHGALCREERRRRTPPFLRGEMETPRKNAARWSSTFARRWRPARLRAPLSADLWIFAAGRSPAAKR